MLENWRQAMRDWGLARRMERHNFLFQKILRDVACTFPYRGIVLDLGCGRGPYREAILKKADRWVGVDWPSSMHGSGKVHVYADLNRALPFRTACADTATAFMVLEHLRRPERFLDECRRVLRPDGRLVLTVPFIWQEHEIPHDYFRYTRYGVRDILERCGFEVQSMLPLGGFWLTWVMRFNYHTARWARGPLRPVMYVLWWFSQVFAYLLDRWDPTRDDLQFSACAVVARCRDKESQRISD